MDTQDLIVNLRVTPSSGVSGTTRPEQLRVQQAADALRDFGFDIVRTGRFAVSVRGHPEQFETALGVAAGDLAGVSGPLTPRLPELVGLVDYVEILPPAWP